MIRVEKYTIEGKVQGVGFRYFAYRNSQALGIKGYAKNLLNGNVEILAIGEDVSLISFKEILRNGPSRSYVERISNEHLNEMDSKEFIKNYNNFNVL